MYYVAGRGREWVDNVLDGFSGWLMSDGWIAYRHYPRRLRCWAHLLRKARGLAQSCDRDARRFGQQVLSPLETRMAAVYAAREGPPAVDLPTQHAPALAELRAACAHSQGSDHGKAHALAVELLNDWAAIFTVLSHPELPLTNNDAERALRHWVILRKLTWEPGLRSAPASSRYSPASSIPAASVATVLGALWPAPSPTAALDSPSRPCRTRGSERLPRRFNSPPEGNCRTVRYPSPA
ncbi:MAG: transposase [Candidatus Competibacteraceae bacterium]|nr:transposase [Candidatus Competibacteraceae bacterium]